MPKKQEVQTVDRFRIIGETTTEKVGPVLAQLARFGVQVTGCELVTDVMSYQRNQSSQQHATSHEDFVLAFIKDHPTFKLSELRAHFLAEGRHGTNAHHVCKRLSDRGVIIDLKGGFFRRADVKEIAAPKLSAMKKQGLRKKDSGVALVRSYIKTRKTVNTTQLKTLFKGDGRKEDGAHATIHQLVNAGELKKTGKGQYDVVKKKAQPHLNGSRSSANAEVAAHG